MQYSEISMLNEVGVQKTKGTPTCFASPSCKSFLFWLVPIPKTWGRERFLSEIRTNNAFLVYMPGINLVCKKQETKSRIHKALGYSDMLDKML